MKLMYILTAAMMAGLIFPHASYASAPDNGIPELNGGYNRVSLFFTPKMMRLNAPWSRAGLMQRGCAFEARLDFQKDKTMLNSLRKSIEYDKADKSILLRNIIVLHGAKGNTVELDFGEEENSEGQIFGTLRKEGTDKHVAISASGHLMDELRNWARKNATQKTFYSHCAE